ncbi:MAG TPA: sigma-70 family RNA polymerase sigma factor [Opitutaceae bacterium]|nr:sigma-70 family RNA polymerase sigma factor [Opitutaceae bacterium]
MSSFTNEDDFTELVRRHLGAVYHAALRRTGGRADLAEEVSQTVFTTLACKAPGLLHHPTLAGWLYLTTRHVAENTLRAEQRRRARELEAHRMSDIAPAEAEPEWQRIREELDGVMDELSERDREAILLRFFHGHAFEQIGAVCGLSEDAARKRVDRALEKLRERLRKKGVTSTAIALGTLLAGQSALAAPAGLAQTIAGTALAAQAAGAGAATAGIIQFMGVKTTFGIAAAGLAGLLFIPAAGIFVYERHEAQEANAAVVAAQRDYDAAEARLKQLQENVRAADQRAAELQAETERARVAAAAKPAPSQPASASPRNSALEAGLADGQKFMAAYPQARGMVLELGRAQVNRSFAAFYLYHPLTAAQREEIENQTALLWLNSIVATPRGINPSVTQLPDDQLQQILGKEGYQAYLDYDRVKPAYDIAVRLATVTGLTGSPLQPQQTEQVIAAIKQGSDAYRNGGALTNDSIDWGATSTQVKTVLTPAQWRAAEAVLLDLQFKQAVNQARGTTAPTASKAKS